MKVAVLQILVINRASLTLFGKSLVFFIKKGKVAAILPEHQNFEFLEVREGYYFGEVDLLNNQEQREYTFQAKEDCDLLILSKKKFKEFFLSKFKKIGTELVENAIVREMRMKDIYAEALEECQRRKRRDRKSKTTFEVTSSFYKGEVEKEKFNEAIKRAGKKKNTWKESYSDEMIEDKKEREKRDETKRNNFFRIPEVMEGNFTSLEFPEKPKKESKEELFENKEELQSEEEKLGKGLEVPSGKNILMSYLKKGVQNILRNENVKTIEKQQSKILKMIQVVESLVDSLEEFLNEKEKSKKCLIDSQTQTDPTEILSRESQYFFPNDFEDAPIVSNFQTNFLHQGELLRIERSPGATTEEFFFSDATMREKPKKTHEEPEKGQFLPRAKGFKEDLMLPQRAGSREIEKEKESSEKAEESGLRMDQFPKSHEEFSNKLEIFPMEEKKETFQKAKTYQVRRGEKPILLKAPNEEANAVDTQALNNSFSKNSVESKGLGIEFALESISLFEDPNDKSKNKADSFRRPRSMRKSSGFGSGRRNSWSLTQGDHFPSGLLFMKRMRTNNEDRLLEFPSPTLKKPLKKQTSLVIRNSGASLLRESGLFGQRQELEGIIEDSKTKEDREIQKNGMESLEEIREAKRGDEKDDGSMMF